MGWLAGLVKGILEALLPFLFKPKAAEKADDAEPLTKEEAEWLAAQIRGPAAPARRVRDGSKESHDGPHGVGGRKADDGGPNK